MKKTILLTGATDGIGLGAARMLVARGHHLLAHGRSADKLDRVARELSELAERSGGRVERLQADLSRLDQVEALARAVAERHPRLDVIINNAGVFKTSKPVTPEGLDLRFVVNALAPYLLTQRLLPLLDASGRVINVSSAAQSPVNAEVMTGRLRAPDFPAYAQSKLAITMWSRQLALTLGEDGPAIVAVNPGSMLGTKMVKEGFGVAGGDARVGAEILTRAALSEEFAAASGRYFDNDAGRFAPPHPDALDPQKRAAVMRLIESTLAGLAA